ncbi:LPS-assembly protein LptD [Aestuariibius insulae]|uniref:LPS-assembly protein LptD n=1 Tax=Aestuariibius insulae TaxID=2058287 RepID=UPI00345F14AC
MRALLALCLCLLPCLAQAQGAATLVADRVFIEGEERLIAEGNVEVLYDGTRLTATRVIFDQPSDTLTIDGPIVIETPDGTILLADQGQIQPTLENGLLRGARLVLDRQLQLAATQIDRVEGRYSQLYKTSVTSCTVCGTRAPLWSIRAERIIHDEQERQLYLENAQFLIRGVPILWLPRARLPDPTLERTTGLLVPELRFSSELGTGIKLPYFITLGRSRDLTLTPYLAPGTRTLEFRYRQAFRSGDLTIEGAVTDDDILPEEGRGYLSVLGEFEIGPKTDLLFDITTVSDNAYLLDYGISRSDTVESRIELVRTERDLFASAALVNLEYLRDNQNNADEPNLIGDLFVEQRLFPAMGGELRAGLDGRLLYRASDDLGVEGRDLVRLGTSLSYRRDTVTAAGLRLTAEGALFADYFSVGQDNDVEQSALRLTPVVAATLRYPLSRTRPSGATELLEPVAQIVWSDSGNQDLANEESTRADLDEGNLFALDRFPGGDLREDGLRANLGVSWTRYNPRGWSSTLTLGRILRADDAPAFSDTSGLSGRQSDWLLAGQIRFSDALTLASRSLVEDSFDFGASETRIDFDGAFVDLSASHIWLAADPEIDRNNAVSEWAMEAAYRISPNWELSTDARYDIRADDPVEAGLGLVYRNECVEVDLSLSRRYTSSDTVDPTTDFDITVGLRGFSAGRSADGPVGRCRN